jgi:hypothetical protein
MITEAELMRIIPKSTPEQRAEKERAKLCKQMERKVEKPIIRARKRGENMYSIELNYKLSQNAVDTLRRHFAKLGYRVSFFPYTYANVTDITFYWGDAK